MLRVSDTLYLSPLKKYVYPLGSHQIAVSILWAGTPCPYWCRGCGYPGTTSASLNTQYCSSAGTKWLSLHVTCYMAKRGGKYERKVNEGEKERREKKAMAHEVKVMARAYGICHGVYSLQKKSRKDSEVRNSGHNTYFPRFTHVGANFLYKFIFWKHF